MKYPTDKLRTNTLKMALILIGFTAVIAYGTVSFTAQDSLWFLKSFDARPTRIVVYHDGQRTEYLPWEAGFDELANAVQASLASGVSATSAIGLSDASLQDAYNQYVTLEVFFDHPVKLHAWFNTGWATQMLFPITGRHSDRPIVFQGDAGQYLASAPLLNTKQPIVDALKSLGWLSGQ